MQPNVDLFKYVLSIDVGINNLGMMLLECTKSYEIHDIVWFDKIDMTRFNHIGDPRKCHLHHSSCLADWMAHIFYQHAELFDLCEIIIVERQPLKGFVSIEQMIFYQFRHKCVLVHPRSVHAFFGNSGIDYNERKKKSVNIMLYFLKNKSGRDWLLPHFNSFKRKHDIADAYIQAVFFLYKKREEKQTRRKSKSILGVSLDKYMHIEQKEYID